MYWYRQQDRPTRQLLRAGLDRMHREDPDDPRWPMRLAVLDELR